MFHICSFSSASLFSGHSIIFSGHSIMEDGSGISPWNYFFLGSVLFAEAFNFLGEGVGGQNCMF